MKGDVLVVGAGPGGSAAAYWLARAGVDVLLVDKAHFPRDKPCGDGLTPQAVSLLEKMGLAATLAGQGRAFAGVRVFLEDGRSSTINLPRGNDGHPRRGLVIPRRELDEMLRQQAMAAGARFLPGFTALAPHYHHGQLAGAEGFQAGNRLTIEARLVIMATGASHTFAQALGLSNGDRPRALALRGYLAGVQELDEFLEIYFERELLPGYAWLFPTGEGTANIGAGINLNGMTTAEGGRRLRTAFDRLKGQRRLAGARLLGRPQGFPLRTDFPHLPVFASGLLVVGEAAGLVDPLTGEGIALALESGQLAAEVACEALRTDDCSARSLGKYDQVLRERYTDYFVDARELLTRLSPPRVIEALLRHSTADARIGQALTTAILEGKPRHSITLLGSALGSGNDYSLAGPVFTLSAYRPLLDRCRKFMLEHVAMDTPSPHVLQIIERGKMLRALLVFLGCQAAGGDPVQVLPGAAGIELVHAASLIHDDIMDGAEMRRGLPALHLTLGVPRAIVCGDYLIAKAFRLLAENRLTSPAAHVVAAFVIGAESGIRTCAGQFQDVGLWPDEALTRETYERLVAGKTAAAIAGALMAGATLAGGDGQLLVALARYGEGVGLAFQIRDDVLDFIDVSTNGCHIDRKLSLPLIHAFEHGDYQSRILIRRFLEGEDVMGSEITKLLQTTGSLTSAQAVASSFAEEAIRLGKDVPHVPDVLEAFARYVVLREQ